MTDEIHERRAQLKEHLNDIVESYHQIDKVMSETRHRRGRASRSLQHRSGMYITHISDKGIESTYQGDDGQWYTIQILRQER